MYSNKNPFFHLNKYYIQTDKFRGIVNFSNYTNEFFRTYKLGKHKEQNLINNRKFSIS